MNHTLVNREQQAQLIKVQPVFSYKLRYILGFWLVETNQKPTIYRNLYENTSQAVL